MPDTKKTKGSDGVRLQKYLSQTGHCSRRQAERLMIQGKVSVNGEVVTELGTRVVPGKDKIKVDGETIESDNALIYALINKPRGMITSMHDPEGRPTVTELVPKAFGRIWPVGRLDWDSEGLILMTNDGELTNALTHPSSGVEKSYIVKIKGLVPSNDVGVRRLRKGVTLDDGFETSSAEITTESTTDRHTWLHVVIHEGHNRQIRRMCEAVGYDVLKLRRVGLGPIAMGGLKPGNYRLLDQDEVLTLYRACELEPPTALRQYSPRNLLAGLASTAKPKSNKPTDKKKKKKKKPTDKKKRFDGGPKGGGKGKGKPEAGGRRGRGDARKQKSREKSKAKDSKPQRQHRGKK